MLYSVITTIQEPTPSVFGLVSKLVDIDAKLIVAGDTKGPARFDGRDGHDWPVNFLSISDQNDGRFKLAENLPTRHYARKNIAYLQAISEGASCIYETDDDNTPNRSWHARQEVIRDGLILKEDKKRWVNVYRYFSKENIWPRGLPLDEIRVDAPVASVLSGSRRAPIQQGLVNGSPDVDAIWRLVMDREFDFDNGPSIYLERGNWCPFNTQTTWWWPVAYPLLYIPSYCSFRMCDIWKSFIAQRCLWAMELGIVFHAPEVVQDRNPHDLTKDFRDEISGYEDNRRIAEILDNLELNPGEDQVGDNLRLCYLKLTEEGIFPEKELPLMNAWLEDLSNL